MSYLDRVRACNTWRPSDYLPFEVAGREVGAVRPAFAEQLARFPAVFRVTPEGVGLAPALDTPRARTEAVAEVLARLAAGGLVRPPQGEPFPVTAGGPTSALMLLDRRAVVYFGTRGFGQHINGYVREGEHLEMWIGRRSRHKDTAPGKLDNLVAGGLPYGVSLRENLAKECWEEAGIPEGLAARARPVGLVSYRMGHPLGLKPGVQYCYDLELPPDFAPRCTDGEVDEFYRWPLERVAEAVRDSEAFKKNCNLVVIDFLIRHGRIVPEDEGYLDLVNGLRQS